MRQKFHKLLQEPLIWKSDGLFKQSYTLYHADLPIAHLRQESGIFKSDASIYWHEAKEPVFIFRPKGILNTRIDIECNDLDFAPAKLKPLRWGGGLEVHFLDGNKYIWKHSNFWNNRWVLTSSADNLEIATLQVKTWSSGGTITLLSDAPSPAELNLLLFAGWTQYIFEQQAAAAG